MDSLLRVCTKCKTPKELSEFRPRRASKDGINTHCIVCLRIAGNAWVQKNIKKVRRKARQWRKNNPERAQARTRKYQQSEEGRTKSRAKRLTDLYNISLEEYDNILAFQAGVCAISGRPPGKTRLSTDHCHTSGMIRGLLDWKMNKAIAMFEDNPTLLRAAADYLERPTAPQALGKPRYGMIGKAKTGKRKTLYGSATGPQAHRDLSR